MHHVELDQSGRTEKLNQPSVLGFTDGIASSILITAKEKRRLYAVLKARYRKLHLVHIRVFVAAVFVLIQDDLTRITTLTIDREFDGHEANIKAQLLRLIRTIAPDFPAEAIVIQSIGKKSLAHDLVHKVFLKKQPPHRVVNANHLLPLI